MYYTRSPNYLSRVEILCSVSFIADKLTDYIEVGVPYDYFWPTSVYYTVHSEPPYPQLESTARIITGATKLCSTNKFYTVKPVKNGHSKTDKTDKTNISMTNGRMYCRLLRNTFDPIDNMNPPGDIKAMIIRSLYAKGKNYMLNFKLKAFFPFAI